MSLSSKLRKQIQAPEGVDSVDWSIEDTEIKRFGTSIILPNQPAEMPLSVAIQVLQRKKVDEETIHMTHEVIDAYPTDAAVAFFKAMKQKYGWASSVPTPGFFGPTPPEFRTIQVGPWLDDTVQVPWGSFLLPGVDEPITCTETDKNTVNGYPVFIIYGEVKKRSQQTLRDLANLTREILAKESIYKGKAIRMRTDKDGKILVKKPPEFLHTSFIQDQDLVLNPDELDQIKVALWTPIQKTDLCLAAKIPLKRGILLEGQYGTGKTLVATITSKVCVQNNWTYIVLDDVRALREALLFAKRYAPAVVFAEDVDRIVESRDQAGNDLLNTIDGILSKDSQVITVLTTNYIEKINKAMLRPGRLDAVVRILPPGPETCKKLIKIYTRGLLPDTEDLTAVSHEIAGNIPATIREVVERSKLAMIMREDTVLQANDLLIAAKGMRGHMDLLQDKKPEPSVAETLASSLKSVIGPNGEFREIQEKLEEMHDTLRA